MVSRQKRQRLDVARAHHREMAPIQGRELIHAETFGERDDRRVGGPQWQVGVAGHELVHPCLIDLCQLDWREVTLGQRSEEQFLDARP